MYTVTEDDFLQHHGIVGMKWGVKHGPPYPLNSNISTGNRLKKENSAEKTNWKKYAVRGAIAVGAILAVAGGVYLYKRMNPSSFGFNVISGKPLSEYISSMENDPVILKKGQRIQRISTSRTEDLIKKGNLYVSYKLGDNAKYMDRMPTTSWFQGNPAYKQTWKTSREIKAPSRQEAAKLFMQVAGEDVPQSRYMRFMQYGIRAPRNGQEDDPLRVPFIKLLKSKGYDAVIDENDVGWTNKPLILLDPKTSIGLHKSREVGIVDRILAVYLS